MQGLFSEQQYERVIIDPIPEKLQKTADSIIHAQSGRQLIESYKEFETFINRLITMVTVSSVRYSIDTSDTFYVGERDYYDEFMPVVEALVADVSKGIAASPYRADLAAEIGDVAILNMELNAKAVAPDIIAELQRENALTSAYEELIASAKIEFDGKVLTIPQLGPYAISKDRAVREAAVRAQGQFFADNATKLDEIFDELVRLRTAMAQKLGFKNFVEMGYCRRTRNCYTAKDVASFRNHVVRHIVPYVGKLMDKQYKRTGIQDPKFWDRSFAYKSGNPTPKDTPEIIFENGKKMYHELSPETGEFMDFMLEHELFDVLSKPNKANGGYCTDMPDFKAPFVFANFNGTQGDIEVLTHECGHAFECYVSMRKYDYSAPQEYTYDIAEIHSMSMEFFTYPWMALFFKEDTEKFYFSHLFGAIQFWPYGCLVDHFQHSVYENPDWTPKQRNEEWLRLEAIYRPGIDFADLPHYRDGGMWQRQLHIFMEPFYYIDYCLAQYVAVCYWSMINEDREAAWQNYFGVIEKAGTRDYLTLLREAGIESPFSEGALDALAEKVFCYLMSIEKAVTDLDAAATAKEA
jgi:M3 family oligoendopeptidase